MIKEAIHKLVLGENLSTEETEKVMSEIMGGEATNAQISAFLTALRIKGETVDEITACARVMRDMAVRLKTNGDVLEIVGTGSLSACAIRFSINFATSVEPVNTTPSKACCTNAAPKSPAPSTNCNASFGTPAWCKSFTAAYAIREVCSAGLAITAFPAARLAATCPVKIAKGKFQGEIQRTFPLLVLSVC